VATAPGGDGGGAIRLSVTGTLTNNGIIRVLGRGGGSDSSYGGAGGGSGGSIWITALNLGGDSTGTFIANGGSGGSGNVAANWGGGGGGGGRIAIWCPTRTPEDIISMFNGGNLSAPSGGAGKRGGQNGSIGTLYIKNHPSTTITVE
jgi:hypothetical protein